MSRGDIGRWIVDCAILVCVWLVLALGPLAAWAVPQPATAGNGAVLAQPPAEARTVDSLRTLPLMEANSRVTKEIRNNQILGNASDSTESATPLTRLVDSEVTRLLGGAAATDFWAAHAAMFEAPTDATVYPPVFPPLTDFWSRWLTPEFLSRSSDELLDLAGLLALAGAHDQGQTQWAGAASYALLRQMVDAERTCDAQLSMAFVASLGYAYIADDALDKEVIAEFDRATHLCGDDLTPGMYLGNYLLNIHLTSRGPRTDRAALDRVIRHYEQLGQDHPESALPTLALASTYLLDAEDRVNRTVPEGPFVARAGFTAALDYFDIAVRATGDQTARLGRARALAGLGRNSEALVEVQGLASPATAVRTDLTVTLLERLGRFAEAASWSQSPLGPMHDPLKVALRADIAVPGLVDAFEGFVVFDTIGGSGAEYLDFLPSFRPDEFTTIDPTCFGVRTLRNLILAGRSAAAVSLAESGLPPSPYPNQWCGTGSDDETLRSWRQVALAEAGLPFGWTGTSRVGALMDPDVTPAEGSTLMYATRQNLWRSAGDLSKAEAIVNEWVDRQPTSPWPWTMLGEIHLLQSKDDQAVDDLRTGLSHFGADEVSAEGELVFGEAWEATRAGISLRLAHALALTGEEEAAEELWWQAVPDFGTYRKGAASALLQIGTRALLRDDLDTAIDTLEFAAATDEHEGFAGVIENNLALALAKAGRSEEAVPVARRAMQFDPANPVFVETLAYAQSLGPEPTSALEAYAGAVRSDPTLYTAWNNLGVLQARRGEWDQGIKALTTAVSVRADYAYGWLNLGRALVNAGGPVNFIRGQGALARAIELDPSLRGRTDDFLLETRIYRSTLDLSRPVPPDWTFATATAAPLPVGPTILGLVVAGFRILWALGLDRLVERGGAWVLRRRESRNAGGLGWAIRFGERDIPWPWAVLAGATVLLFPLRDLATTAPAELVVAAATTLLALLLFVRVRVWAAAGLPHRWRQRTWVTPIAFSGAVTALGACFVPLPVLTEADGVERFRVRWAGPIVLGGLTLASTVVAMATDVPVARLVAVTLLAIVASALIPIKPFDGGHLTNRWLGLGIGIVLAVVAACFLLEVI